MKPEVNLNEPWKICDYNDMDYEGGNNNQKIASGYTIIINGFLISCFSKSQKTVTLSVTEAKFI